MIVKIHVKGFLKERGLELSVGKTHITKTHGENMAMSSVNTLKTLADSDNIDKLILLATGSSAVKIKEKAER